MAHPAPQTESRTSPRRRAANAPLAVAALTTRITLNSPTTQRVYRRTFERLKADIYTLTVRTRTLDLDEAADTAEGIIATMFDQLQKDLREDIRRTDLSMERDGITDTGVYAAAATMDATITTPLAKRFLDIIQAVDTLIVRLDVLWLNDSIDTRNCKDRAYTWQRRLFKTANRIREHAHTARKAMQSELQRRGARARPSAGDDDRPTASDADGVEETIDAEATNGSGHAAEADDDAPALLAPASKPATAESAPAS